jgi:hypothetical protein
MDIVYHGQGETSSLRLAEFRCRLKAASPLLRRFYGRIEREGAGDENTLLHAARQLPGIVLSEPPELHQIEHLLRPAGTLSPRELHHFKGQLDILLHGAPFEKDRALENDPVVPVQAGLPGRLALDEHAPGSRGHQISDDPQQGGFATARWTDQGDEFPGIHLKIDRLQSGGVWVVVRSEDLRGARTTTAQQQKPTDAVVPRRVGVAWRSI